MFAVGWAVPFSVLKLIGVNALRTAHNPFAPEVLHTRNAILDDGTIVDW